MGHHQPHVAWSAICLHVKEVLAWRQLHYSYLSPCCGPALDRLASIRPAVACVSISSISLLSTYSLSCIQLQDFERLLQDVNRTIYKTIKVYVDEVFLADPDDEDGGTPTQPESPDMVLISFEEFKSIMDEHDVIPIWVNPHQFAQHKQAPAFRGLSPAEREVLLLLGSEITAAQGQMLIQENESKVGEHACKSVLQEFVVRLEHNSNGVHGVQYTLFRRHLVDRYCRRQNSSHSTVGPVLLATLCGNHAELMCM